MQPLSCFNLQERVVPYLRAESARRLSKQGLRQARIAEHLGVSQAMVSKYLRSTLGPPPGAPAQYLQTVVERSVRQVLDDEQKGRVPAWCPLCPQLGTGVPTKGPDGHMSECLRGETTLRGDESQQVIENLKNAAERIRKKEFSRLAPEVFINLSMSVPDARDSRGVAAFPGRMVETKGEVRAVFDPEFGASNHLSQILLKVRKAHPEIRAVICLRDGEDVRAALRGAGLRARILKRARGELLVHAPATEPLDAFIDPGDFGIEPITYVFGQTALDVVEKAENLLQRLPAPRGGHSP